MIIVILIFVEVQVQIVQGVRLIDICDVDEYVCEYIFDVELVLFVILISGVFFNVWVGEMVIFYCQVGFWMQNNVICLVVVVVLVQICLLVGGIQVWKVVGLLVVEDLLQLLLLMCQV